MSEELHDIKVEMTVRCTYKLMSEELKELLKDFRELAEHRGFIILDED